MISCKEYRTVRYVGYYLQRRVLHIAAYPKPRALYIKGWTPHNGEQIGVSYPTV